MTSTCPHLRHTSTHHDDESMNGNYFLLHKPRCNVQSRIARLAAERDVTPFSHENVDDVIVTAFARSVQTRPTGSRELVDFRARFQEQTNDLVLKVQHCIFSPLMHSLFLHTLACPPYALMYRGVTSSLVRPSTSAPAFNNSSTTSLCPVLQEACSGDHPLSSHTSMGSW